MDIPIAESNPGDILIVDDTPANLRLLTQMLTKRGHKVRAVLDGPHALAAAQAAPPDLILLDVMMPDMDGYAVCEQLKADERTRSIPVLFVSAMSETVDKVKGFAMGGVDYIAKPFHMAEVMARVEKHLTISRLQKQLEEQNAALQHKVAEREQAEAEQRYLNARLQILHEIDLAIVGAQSPAAIARSILGRLSQLAPCQRVSVLEFESEETAKVLAVEARGAFSLDLTSWLELLHAAACKQPLIQGVADIGELAERTPLQERLFAEGVHSYVLVPLFAQGEVIGALFVEADRPNVFVSEHVNVMAEVAGMLAVAIRHAQLRTSLEQRTAQLEAQNAELDAFAHTVAHDLKNPLSVVVSYADLLAQSRDQLTEQQFQEFAEATARGALKAVDIVNNLLLLASANKMKVTPQPLHMGGLVREVQSRLANMIQKYRPEIVLPDMDAWPAAMGYAPWIEQVWANYLSNALKYGGQPPRIEPGATPLTIGETRYVRFWVRDNGQGITADDQARLFTPFERLSQVEVGGHGLGLSIVKRIVEKLGGQVGVESPGVPGLGSTFYFTLPAAPDAPGTSKVPSEA